MDIITLRCKNMLNDLQGYKRNKDDLLLHYINERLDTSLVNYYKDLDNSLNYLSRRNELRLLKKLNRLK